MPANEFEKRVQEQMDQFRLNPSASVWKKVEEQIREKKRRRIIFFFLLPLAMGLVGFSIYLFNTGGNTEMAQPPAVAVKPNSGTLEQSNLPVQSNEQKTVVEEPGQENSSGQTSKTGITVGEKVITNKRTSIDPGSGITTVEAPSFVKPDKTTTGKYDRDTRKQDQQADAFVITTDAPAKQKKATIEDTQVTVTAIKDVAVDMGVQKDKQADNPVTSETPVVSADSIKEGNAIVAESKQETIVNKKKGASKIKWGIDLFGGMTFNNEGTLSFPGTRSADMYYANPGGSAGTGNPPVAGSNNPPSGIKPGAAFRLGVVGEWQVSPRSRFSAGLQYAYASTRIKVGVEADTSFQLQSNANGFSSTVGLNSIYRGAPQNDYTNSYHFIQLPVWYHWQVNKGSRLRVFLDAGISVGYMFATNGLVYDKAIGGIYYSDKDAFNKLHFNLGTGLSFRFSSKNSMEWMIGPELGFDMTGLVKGNTMQYLMFSGIHAKLFLPKKKK